ncbi:MAG: hypothetical protein E7465_07780 [Ruminococcaceae bacterium]|nr:hypothetical protein [Oscillospiraceae bacterium]
MKRKLISFLLLLSLLISLSVTAFATDTDAPWVVDNAGLLTSEEQSYLTQQIQTLRSELELEIVIVTTYGTDGKGVQAYADDFYDINGYGYGDTNSGILLLLDMDAREWYMSTCGDAIYIFTDYGLDRLGQTILPWLSSGNYYEAFQYWLNDLPEYVEAYRNHAPIDGYVQPDDYESPYGDEVVYYDDFAIENPFPIALIIGLVAAAITILVMRGKMNTAKFQSGATDYLKDGSFHLRRRSDMFLYSRVTKTPRPKDTSSGGGSSVHRSSGGVSHGGRGGRF